MANYLINGDNLALVEGTDKTTGDSLENMVDNLMDRITDIEGGIAWKNAGSVTGSGSNIQVPMTAKEIYIEVVTSTVALGYFSTVIPTAIIPASTHMSRLYRFGNDDTDVQVSLNHTIGYSYLTVRLTDVFQNSASQTSGSTMTVYYR